MNDLSQPLGLTKAIQFAGSQSALARLVKVSPQAVQQWVQAGRVSHLKVRKVHQITGIPLSELRPDLYSTEPATA